MDRLRLATWNVRGLGNKEAELNDVLRKQKVNIAIITETKKKLKGTKDMNDYTMIYSGVSQEKRACCGVAILIDNKWKSKIVNYTYINERILITRLKIDRGHLTILGVYAPEEGKKEETQTFYEELQKVLNKINKNDFIVLSGDLNARVGNIPIDNTVGIFGEPHANDNGYELRHFATYNKLKITNTFFRHKEIHKYTWSARGLRSLIDYVIVNDKLSALVEDTRVYRGSDIHSDHYLVLSSIRLLTRWKKYKLKQKTQTEELFKVHLLEEASIRELYQRRLTQNLLNVNTSNNIDEEWNNIKTAIIQIASECLGKRKKTKHKRGLRIWNEELQQSIKNKQKAYLRYIQSRKDEDWNNYKTARNATNILRRQAHQESWDTFISRVEDDIHGRQTFAYKIIKHLNKTEKDTAGINVIQENQWIEHYKNLWTNKDEIYDEEENEKEKQEVDPLTLEELQGVLRKAKNRKATGSDGVNTELLKYGGTLLHLRLLHLYNECWQRNKIPKEWKVALVISLFKKGDRNNCENYRGISLLNTSYKLYTKMINERLKTITEEIILEEQNGFRKGRSCNDNVFTIKQIIEKRREFNQETHLAFVDFEKAFDRVNRNKLWEIMTRKGYPLHLIESIKCLYKNSRVMIKEQIVSEPFQTNQGLKQGCSLSPTLFNIYIDDITKEWKKVVKPGLKISKKTHINALLFADDLAIIQETEDDLQRSLHQLNNLCKTYNMKISYNKTKVMAFKGTYPVRTKIIIDNRPIEQVSHFNYLGCDVSYNYDNDITNKLHKYQYICGTIYRSLRNKVRPETILKFYKTMAAPVLLYGCESWTMRKKDTSRIQTTEMKFLRRIKGCTLRDRIRNIDIREELDIYSINDKIKRNKEEWKSHIDRMNENRYPKQIRGYKPKGRRPPGRPMKRWHEE